MSPAELSKGVSSDTLASDSQTTVAATPVPERAQKKCKGVPLAAKSCVKLEPPGVGVIPIPKAAILTPPKEGHEPRCSGWTRCVTRWRTYPSKAYCEPCTTGQAQSLRPCLNEGRVWGATGACASQGGAACYATFFVSCSPS